MRHASAVVLPAALLTGLSLAAPSWTAADTVFGPKSFVRTTGSPNVFTESFDVCETDRQFLLRVENGPDGAVKIASATVTLNDTEVVHPSDFSPQVTLIERAVRLRPSNTLTVQLAGTPVGTARLRIVSPAGCGPEIAITSPPAGASVPEGVLQVRGTVEGPPDVGVAVNGVPAAVHGGEFVALLQVSPGPTNLKAAATAPDGSTAEASESVTVVEAPETAVRLLASPPGGLSPLTVRFSLSSLIGITDVKLDLEGDGPVEFEGSSLDGQVFTYRQPGVYVATVHATDIDRQVHSAMAVVEAYDRAALDLRLQAVWSGCKDAVRLGDVTRAASFLHSETRDAYADQLRLLRPQTLASIDTYLTAIRLVEVGPKGAEYEMLRDRHGVTLSFAVWFRVDRDGLWRLFSF